MGRQAEAPAAPAAARRRRAFRPPHPRRDLPLDERNHVGHGRRDLRRERVRVGAHVADLDGEDHDLGVGAGQARVGHQVRDAHAVDVVGAQRHDADVVGAEAEDLARFGALAGGVEGVDDDDHVGLEEVLDQPEPRRLADDDVEAPPQSIREVPAAAGGDRPRTRRVDDDAGVGKQAAYRGHADAVVAHQSVAYADDRETAAGLRPAAVFTRGVSCRAQINRPSSRRGSPDPAPAVSCSPSAAGARRHTLCARDGPPSRRTSAAPPTAPRWRRCRCALR